MFPNYYLIFVLKYVFIKPATSHYYNSVSSVKSGWILQSPFTLSINKLQFWTGGDSQRDNLNDGGFSKYHYKLAEEYISGKKVQKGLYFPEKGEGINFDKRGYYWEPSIPLSTPMTCLSNQTCSININLDYRGVWTIYKLRHETDTKNDSELTIIQQSLLSGWSYTHQFLGPITKLVEFNQLSWAEEGMKLTNGKIVPFFKRTALDLPSGIFDGVVSPRITSIVPEKNTMF